MKLKLVFRRDRWLIRIVRVMWIRGTVGDGLGYSAKLSLGLYPRWFAFVRGSNEWRLYLLGLRLHFERAYGGIHV